MLLESSFLLKWRTFMNLRRVALLLFACCVSLEVREVEVEVRAKEETKAEAEFAAK